MKTFREIILNEVIRTKMSGQSSLGKAIAMDFGKIVKSIEDVDSITMEWKKYSKNGLISTIKKYLDKKINVDYSVKINNPMVFEEDSSRVQLNGLQIYIEVDSTDENYVKKVYKNIKGSAYHVSYGKELHDDVVFGSRYDIGKKIPGVFSILTNDTINYNIFNY